MQSLANEHQTPRLASYAPYLNQHLHLLNHQVPVTIAPNYITMILLFFFLFYLLEKTSINTASELFARQTIHMQYQTTFSQKIQKKKYKLLSATTSNGALSLKTSITNAVDEMSYYYHYYYYYYYFLEKIRAMIHM